MALHWFSPPVAVKTDRSGATYAKQHLSLKSLRMARSSTRTSKLLLLLAVSIRTTISAPAFAVECRSVGGHVNA